MLISVIGIETKNSRSDALLKKTSPFRIFFTDFLGSEQLYEYRTGFWGLFTAIYSSTEVF